MVITITIHVYGKDSVSFSMAHDWQFFNSELLVHQNTLKNDSII